jgi:hypothetical protein
MDIGGLSFDVTPGLRRQLCEHIVATLPKSDPSILASGAGKRVADADDEEEEDDDEDDEAGGAADLTGRPPPSHFVVLGPIASTLVVTPDLESLIAGMETEMGAKAGRLTSEYAAHVPPPLPSKGGRHRSSSVAGTEATGGAASDAEVVVTADAAAAGQGGQGRARGRTTSSSSGGGGGGAMKADPGAAPKGRR